MKRKDREIHDRALIGQIIAKAQVCRLGLCKDNMPYIVPVSFGYDGAFVYFHTTFEGMKLDYIAANGQVCFELEHGVKIFPDANEACNWSFAYDSVIGFGTVEEIVDYERKLYALDQIMKHYSNREWSISDKQLETVRLWGISVERVTGKRSDGGAATPGRT